MQSRERTLQLNKLAFRLLTLVGLLLTGVLSPVLAQDQDESQVRQEEEQDYFKKWLQEDVKYIITDEEKSVFENLTTPEEKEAFIEQFWFRRDPDPRTANNEFKEEHYRRIAYANEKFQSGKPGWMTDRGRVYIVHGEPEYIEQHPAGGPYQRSAPAGGGSSWSYPFEVWNYRYLEGVGQDIQLEFVDPSFSGEYRLALRPEEKDQLLYVSGTAPTIREVLGLESGRVDRAYFNPGLENNAQWRAQHGYREHDTPFMRYMRYASVQRAPEIKFSDLKQIIDTNITYDDLPVEVRNDFIYLGQDQILSPITIQVQNKELTFDRVNGVYQAKANIYGLVKNMVGRVVAEFEDTVVAEYKPELMDQGRRIISIYQKPLILDAGARYLIDVVVRDQHSNRVGVVQKGIVSPKYKEEGLSTSSVILSSSIEPAPDKTGLDDRFVLGDVRIIPKVGNVFTSEETMGAYLQVYNVALDQSSLQPNVTVRYLVRKGQDVIANIIDNKNSSVQYFSRQRVVLIRGFSLKDFEPGDYQLDIELQDQISKKTVQASQRFEVVESNPVVAGKASGE